MLNDLKELIINKYGTFDNLQSIIKQKNQQKKQRNDKILNVKLEREKNLKELLMMNKLQYKNYGDCYSYVHYGEPTLQQVIENELQKINTKNTKRVSLATELNKLGIQLDENLKSCYEYINGLSTKKLQDVVRLIEVEHFLKHNTNYEELCKKYNINKAKEMAIRQYAENQNLPKNIDKSCSQMKLKFNN